MRLVSTLLVLLLGVAATAAAAVDPARLASAQRALDRARFAESPAALVLARATFETMSTAEPKSSALHYWVAVADWRLAPRIQDPKKAKGYVEDGLAHARRALALDQTNAEALAMQAALTGMSIHFESGLAMSLGPELEMTMGRALGMAPKNPRVHLIDAMNTLHKPEFIGGGADKALVKLEQTLALYDAEAVADSTAPAWGHDDALLWAGQSAMKLEQYALAIEYYRKALEVAPSNGWVRQQLLPAAEKAAAGSTSPKGKNASEEKGKS